MLTIADQTVLVFTQPILGFQAFRRFVTLPDPGGVLTWLQSVESGELAFLLLNPRAVIPDYRAVIRKEELAELDVTSVDELEVYTLVVVPSDRSQVRTNLKAPVLINRKKRLAKQTIMDGVDYPIQYYLAQGNRDKDAPEEVKNARSHA